MKQYGLSFTTTILALSVGVVGATAMVAAHNKSAKEAHNGSVGLAQMQTALPLTQKQWEESEAPFAEANRLTLKGTNLERTGDLAGAEEAVRQALKSTPVVDGEKQPRPQLLLLMGDVCLGSGKYQEALNHYLTFRKNGTRDGLELDIALCYLRLGNPQMAKQFYSDDVILRFVDPSDRESIHAQMPGVTNPERLEASILYARGEQKLMTDRNEQAFVELAAASKLAPQNALIAHEAGEALYRLARYEEAEPYYRTSARFGHGTFVKEAKRRADHGAWVRARKAK